METSQKALKSQVATLNIVSDFIDDLLKLCESEIERMFMSNLIFYLFKSKFELRPSIYYTGSEDHNWNFKDFERIIDEEGPPLEDNEREILLAQGYQYYYGSQHFLVKTTGIAFYDEPYLIHTPDRYTSYKVFPQYIVNYEKKYRIDFAILCTHYSDKKKYKESKIAIECDGFDFHSSKEDLKRDTSRNRELTLNGWKVYRFSGSEVYNMDTELKIDNLFKNIRQLAKQ